MSKIHLEAAKSAPEAVQVGNHYVQQKKGIFAVPTRELADWMIKEKYGKEVEKPSVSAPKPKKKSAPKPKAVVPTPPPITGIATETAVIAKTSAE